jgi:hypothetical protein
MEKMLSINLIQKLQVVASIALLAGVGACSSFTEKPFNYQGQKLKGVSFVAPRDSLSDTCYLPVKQLNAEWVSLMPYGFCETGSPNFMYGRDNKWKWWGESPNGVAHCIEMAHQKGLKVMLKPHMWIGHGTFTGHFNLTTEVDWQVFEKKYGDYLLHFAEIADSTNVDLYCIATEMQTFVKERPEFWSRIIKEIRQIYKGPLTYAENWDSYQLVPFWKELDYVGVDAYFPLSEERSPDLDALRKGWQTHVKEMEKVARSVQKPILFTEFGYVSSDYATRRPWESDRDQPENEKLQAEAYKALFEEVWSKEWMAGGFVWKWFPGLGSEKKARDPFSPQNKHAESVLNYYFEKVSR